MGSLPVKRSAREPEPNSLHALKYASVIVQLSGICKIGKEKPFFILAGRDRAADEISDSTSYVQCDGCLMNWMSGI